MLGLPDLMNWRKAYENVVRGGEQASPSGVEAAPERAPRPAIEVPPSDPGAGAADRSGGRRGVDVRGRRREGEAVIAQGDASDAFYVVETGNFEIEIDGAVVATAGPRAPSASSA
ncbi:cAMP-dependent protein kinase regulator [Aureococcus anophagefferens]|nr:cAMP-dependent protein kinase regulator [Aureococcus anophagefferens]